MDEKLIYLGYRNGVSKTTSRPYCVIYFGYNIEKEGNGIGTFNKMYSGDKGNLANIESYDEVICTYDRYGNVMSVEK